MPRRTPGPALSPKKAGQGCRSGASAPVQPIILTGVAGMEENACSMGEFEVGCVNPSPMTVVVIAVEAGVSGPSSWGPGLTPRGPHAAERPGRKPVGERGVRIWDHALGRASSVGGGNRPRQ